MIAIEVWHGSSGAIWHHLQDQTTQYFEGLVRRVRSRSWILVLWDSPANDEGIRDIVGDAPLLDGYEISSARGVYLRREEIRTFQLLKTFSGKVDEIILRDVLGSPVFHDGTDKTLAIRSFAKLWNETPRKSSKLTDDIDALLSPDGRIAIIETLTPESAKIHYERLFEKGFEVVENGQFLKVLARRK